MKKIITIFSLVLLSLTLSGCEKTPSAMLSDYGDAVSLYEKCLAEQDATCKNDSKTLAVEIYNKINVSELDDGFFSVFDIKREREKKRIKNFNTTTVKMTRSLFADNDYNRAAYFYTYADANGILEQQESKNMLGILINNIDSISDKNKTDLAEVAESHKMPYETFQIKLSYQSYPYHTPQYIVTTLEKYNCYADAALFTNYFIKYDGGLNNILNDKYEEITSNISKEDIKTLNEKIRNLIKNNQKPSLSSDCELNFYKKLN